jgi:hypothetical protein
MERDTIIADTRVVFSPKMNCNRERPNPRAHVNQLLPMDAVQLISIIELIALRCVNNCDISHNLPRTLPVTRIYIYHGLFLQQTSPSTVAFTYGCHIYFTFYLRK